MTNREILDIYLNNGLIDTCLDCQFSNIKDKQFKEDFRNDLILIILNYDNEKLNDAHLNNHFNAFLTRIIINNIFSKTSPYYKDYRKFSDKTDEITTEIEETYGDKSV